MAGALILDFDGTILDTETPQYRAWCEVYEAHGLEPLDIDLWRANIGLDPGSERFDPYDHLTSLVGRVDTEIAVTRRRHRMMDLIRAEEPRRGIVGWLAFARSRGLAVGVASSSPIGWVSEHLDRLQLGFEFEVVSCAGGGLRGKPAPDVYLDACARLGADPGASLAVEDSPPGVRAARAAGLRCLAVPNPVTAGMDFVGATVVAGSLADLDPSALLDRATGPDA